MRTNIQVPLTLIYQNMWGPKILFPTPTIKIFKYERIDQITRHLNTGWGEGH